MAPKLLDFQGPFPRETYIEKRKSEVRIHEIENSV